MIGYVYRPKRRRNGKVVFGRLYRARVQFPGDHKMRDIPLEVTEQRSAEQKLQQILKEHSQESVGLLAPQKMRDAAAIPLAEHFPVFVQELKTSGCVKRYVQGVENYVGTLMKDCAWEHFKDVNAESFQVWRQKQTKAPKTLNEYLVAMRAFLKWAERLGFIARNSLGKVAMLRVQGRQERARRAYTADEIQRLLAVAGARFPVYLLAVLTGIRRGEIKKLRWADAVLDGDSPKITVSAMISKNHYEDALPLHPDLAAALCNLKGTGRKPDEVIFKGMFPGYKRFYKDLTAAGIDWRDTGEGRLDFHSFRVTYCTQLAPGTPSERVRMALMRHRDPKQTAKTYTDARMLPLKDAIHKLSFHRSETTAEGDTQIDTQTSVVSGHLVSTSVTLPMLAESEKNARFTREKSLFVTPSHEGSTNGKWSERQDLNLRRLGSKPCHDSIHLGIPSARNPPGGSVSPDTRP
jgi:integrase